jgi:hypothetical protein
MSRCRHRVHYNNEWNPSMQDRFDHIEAALDRTAANLDRLNGIVATLAASIETRFANVDARFASIDARFASIDTRFANIDARFDSQAKLIEETSASLQREMNTRFDALEIATGRNTKMLAGGSKTVAGLAH